MKIVIGDMSFATEYPEAASGVYPEYIKKHKDEVALKRELMLDFLAVAEKCYIAKHGTKPERSTVDEF